MEIDEYRKIMNDQISPDDKILKRIQYLESLCRTIIKSELESYSKMKQDKFSLKD
jgi:hypothetical protein